MIVVILCNTKVPYAIGLKLCQSLIYKAMCAQTNEMPFSTKKSYVSLYLNKALNLLKNTSL